MNSGIDYFSFLPVKEMSNEYFQVNYTKSKLKDSDYNTLKVRLANSDLHANCRIMLGTDKRATVTTNWSEFRRLSKIHEVDFCTFRFKVTTKQRLVLIVHCL
ncbi:hypothetical protein VPH35_110719 [Triticum aestivum]|uniref:TF-B3 domain-containing protein n=1 Tax=Triticum turgidum subsp. durum TaxID=4567 RepID=A0A9R0YD12_TRITD|nr:unnamed protein product [Triticum turgidum subsp. durum]